MFQWLTSLTPLQLNVSFPKILTAAYQQPLLLVQIFHITLNHQLFFNAVHMSFMNLQQKYIDGCCCILKLDTVSRCQQHNYLLYTSIATIKLCCHSIILYILNIQIFHYNHFPLLITVMVNILLTLSQHQLDIRIVFDSRNLIIGLQSRVRTFGWP